MLDPYHDWNISYKPVFLAFIFALILTIAAYFIVVEHIFTSLSNIYIILGLGVVSALIQLIFFLHLGIEPKPRWNLMIFLFMVLVVFVVIGGSLWIMSNLDYNLMLNMEK